MHYNIIITCVFGMYEQFEHDKIENTSTKSAIVRNNTIGREFNDNLLGSCNPLP